MAAVTPPALRYVKLKSIVGVGALWTITVHFADENRTPVRVSRPSHSLTMPGSSLASGRRGPFMRFPKAVVAHRWQSWLLAPAMALFPVIVLALSGSD